MRRIAFIGIAVLTLSSAAAAQAQKPIELGVDGSLAFGLDSPRITTLSVPVQQLRVGFFVTPTVSIEPTGSLDYVHSGNNSGSVLNLGVGALFHLNAAQTEPQPYVRPFLSVYRNSYDTPVGDESNTALALGAGVGVKIPFATRLAWRLEGAYAHRFKGGSIDSFDNLQLLFGLSYFTR